jgi:hypothetical protein
MLPLPHQCSSLSWLRRLINIRDDKNWVLIACSLAATCRASGPYPILSLQGEQGTAHNDAKHTKPKGGIQW